MMECFLALNLASADLVRQKTTLCSETICQKLMLHFHGNPNMLKRVLKDQTNIKKQGCFE